jgi:hypothetical protein
METRQPASSGTGKAARISKDVSLVISVSVVSMATFCGSIIVSLEIVKVVNPCERDPPLRSKVKTL